MNRELVHPSRPYCRYKETWKTTKTLDGWQSKTGPNCQWLSAWELHRTEWHGVQRCRRLWPVRRDRPEMRKNSPVQSSPEIWQTPSFLLTVQLSWRLRVVYSRALPLLSVFRPKESKSTGVTGSPSRLNFATICGVIKP